LRLTKRQFKFKRRNSLRLTKRQFKFK